MDARGDRQQSRVQIEVRELLPEDDPGGHLGHRHPGDLRQEGNGARSTRVGLDDVDRVLTA